MLSRENNGRPQGSQPLEPPPGVITAFDGTGKEYFFRAGELLVAEDDVTRVRALTHIPNTHVGLPATKAGGHVIRLSLAAIHGANNGEINGGQGIPGLVEALRSAGPPPPVVAPNHFFFGHNHNAWHSATTPKPARSHEPIEDNSNLPGHGTRV